MNTILPTLAALLALACVFAMGFAIQRGGTCTVAAVEELIDRRRGHRLAAMLEASLWVAGGLALAAVAGLLPAMPAAYAVSAWTFVGGALLGVGAWVNGACVFGAIARFGSGQWAYAATPFGFYAGCLGLGALFPGSAATALTTPSPLLQAAELSALLFLAYALLRLLRARPALRDDRGFVGLRALGARVGAKVWSPHAATIVIGITFVATLLLAGRWAYTELLADLAGGQAVMAGLRVALFAALLLGAVWGGYSAGRFAATPLRGAQLARCFAGGALMGWGTLLIPGANDGLILIGLPLLRPYAWLAFATMCVSIALAIWLARAWGRRGLADAAMS
jgi:toxin CptA